MIPLYTHAAAALLAGALAFAGAWQLQSLRYDARIADMRMEHAHTLREIATQAQTAADAVRERESQIQAALADADTRHTRELAHAKTETDRLRACVAAGTCGVRIITRATACAARGDVPQDAGAGSVGDGAVALDGDTAGRVLDLRESVAADAAKLAYLREYASACYRAGAEGAGGVGSAR